MITIKDLENEYGIKDKNYLKKVMDKIEKRKEKMN